MVINSVKIENFRNYKTALFDLHSGVNIICGENAQGKTNFLEAVFFLSCAKSFRARTKKELIAFNSEYAKIFADIDTKDRNLKVEITFSEKGSTSVFINKVKISRNYELAGRLKSVLFSPDDLYLVKSAPSERRKFIDTALIQLRPKYLSLLTEYNRLYDHKARILKDSDKKQSLLLTLDDFTERMVLVGASIIKYRYNFINLISNEAQKIHFGISGGSENLSVSYKTVSTIKDPGADVSILQDRLREHAATHKQAEILSKTVLSGPHKDDLEILINEKSAKSFSSQGQIRTAALSLKLSEYEIFYKDTGEKPVLLLDDVLSELDRKRQDFVLNKLSGGQIIITCCHEDRLSEILSGRAFYISKGQITDTYDLKNMND